MEVLRVPPYPLTTTWTLPIPNYEYIVYVEDLVDHSVTETNIFSDANGKLIYEIPLAQVQYDRKFFIKFYDTEHIHTLYEENLDIVRPYVDPSKLGTTASEIAEYKTLEMVARSIIDTFIVDGFYNSKHIVQKVGDGSDYFSIWEDLNKVLKVYENNVLVYDVDTPEANIYDFMVTFDNSAVQRVITDQYNRIEVGAQNYPRAFGDLGNLNGVPPVAFPKGWDYTFVLDIGYRALPPDVEYATKLLIEDLKCGKLDYYTRYVSSYNSDQFKVQFDKKMFEGTGNMLVDKILDKYTVTIPKPGLI
jgi:hypothetical protein